MPIKEHEHKRPDTCKCCIVALEPNESCPIHGSGDWPPRCKECGQWMKWVVVSNLTRESPNGRS